MYAKFLRGTITGVPNWIDFENSYSLTDSSSPKVMSWMTRKSVSDNARTERKNIFFLKSGKENFMDTIPWFLVFSMVYNIIVFVKSSMYLPNLLENVNT